MTCFMCVRCGDKQPHCLYTVRHSGSTLLDRSSWSQSLLQTRRHISKQCVCSLRSNLRFAPDNPLIICPLTPQIHTDPPYLTVSSKVFFFLLISNLAYWKLNDSCNPCSLLWPLNLLDFKGKGQFTATTKALCWKKLSFFWIRCHDLWMKGLNSSLQIQVGHSIT